MADLDVITRGYELVAARPASLLADAMARCMQEAVRQTLEDCGLAEPV